jgi:hypothetical protein
MGATGVLLVFVGLAMLFGRWRYLRKRRANEPPPDEAWRSFWRRLSPRLVTSDEYYDRLVSLMIVPSAGVLMLGLVTLIQGAR